MTTRNPFKVLRGELKKREIIWERKMMQREETMREDLERYLMEMEDRTTWVTYQLNNVNNVRLKRKEIILGKY